MKRGQDTESGAEPQPGGGRGGGAEWGPWYISSAYQCLHLLVIKKRREAPSHKAKLFILPAAGHGLLEYTLVGHGLG